MPDINEQKRALRSQFRKLRASVNESERKAADRLILSRLIALEQYRNALLLLTYVSDGSEPDTLMLIARALADGKEVACPRCDVSAHTMTFRKIRSLGELSPGAYGLYEPAPDAPETQPEEMQNSVCIVPGLAFDGSGGRLGYGGGYYDRFLAGYCGSTVGLCRSECYSAQPLPRDNTDVTVDTVVTDAVG